MALFILVIAKLFLSNSLCAQDRKGLVSAKIYGVYGFFSPGAFHANSTRPLNKDFGFFSTSKKGLGEGLKLGVGASIKTSSNVAIGIDGEYLLSNKLSTSDHQIFKDSTANVSKSVRLELFSIIPNIAIEDISLGKLTIFNRLGIVIGIPGKMTEDYYYRSEKKLNNTPWNLTDIYHAEYKLKVGFGYQATLGLKARIIERLQLFFEVAGQSLYLNKIKYEETNGYVEYGYMDSNTLFQVTYQKDSRNIIHYKEGVYDDPPQNGVNTYTFSQDPLKINTIGVVLGLTFKF